MYNKYMKFYEEFDLLWKKKAQYNKQECFPLDLNVLAYFYQMFLF